MFYFQAKKSPQKNFKLKYEEKKIVTEQSHVGKKKPNINPKQQMVKKTHSKKKKKTTTTTTDKQT